MVEWLAGLYSNGTYPHEGVFIGNDEDDANVFTYAGWADTIKVCASLTHDHTSK